jgi:acetate kinase
LENLGIKIDAAKNNSTRATEAVINAADSAVKIFVVPTNEELVVARETKRFLETKKN